jgi:sirohydrochlorin ferrochelatase
MLPGHQQGVAVPLFSGRGLHVHQDVGDDLLQPVLAS